MLAGQVASRVANDLLLIKYVAGTDKPMIISKGVADSYEIQDAIDAAREGGCKELAILLCVSGYPAPAEDYNVCTIPDMIKRFGLVTELSDHTLDNTTAITRVALGSSIIEKHFTLDRSGGGPDNSFSLEPAEMAALCRDSKTALTSLGQVDHGRKSSEQGNAQFRRPLYFVKYIKAGDVITSDCIHTVRSGFGLAPKIMGELVGKVVKVKLAKNTPVKTELVSA